MKKYTEVFALSPETRAYQANGVRFVTRQTECIMNSKALHIYDNKQNYFVRNKPSDKEFTTVLKIITDAIS